MKRYIRATFIEDLSGNHQGQLSESEIKTMIKSAYQHDDKSLFIDVLSDLPINSEINVVFNAPFGKSYSLSITVVKEDLDSIGAFGVNDVYYHIDSNYDGIKKSNNVGIRDASDELYGLILYCDTPRIQRNQAVSMQYEITSFNETIIFNVYVN